MDIARDNRYLTDLLRSSAAGDDLAFKEFYTLTNRRVYFYLLRLLRHKEAAEDCLVETFTIVWKSAGQYAERAAPTTWVLGIARNIAMNELRSRKYHADIDDHLELAGGEIPDAEPMDRSRVLDQALGLLSRNHREVIDLVFYHEMNYPEVSAMLDIPVGTVKTRIFHAKAALLAALKIMKVDRDAI